MSNTFSNPNARRRPSGYPPSGYPAKIIARRYHVHLPGIAYAGTTVVLILGAINGQNNLLFWMFGLCVAGLLLGGIASGAALMGVRIRREEPGPAQVGEPLTITYTIHNRNWLVPAMALRIEEMEHARTMLGRKISGQWSGFLPAIVTSAETVRARRDATCRSVVVPLRRGLARLAPVRMSSTFPLGVTRKSVTSVQVQEILIRPRAAHIDPAILRRALGQGRVASRSSVTRTGDEFYALREYAPGDSPRALDWRSTARMDRPIVRSFTKASGPRVWIMLDAAAFAPESAAQSRERAAELLAGLATLALAQGRECGLATSDGGVILPARAGGRHLETILDALALLDIANPVGVSGPGLRPGDASITISTAESARTTNDEGTIILYADGDASGTRPGTDRAERTEAAA